MRRLKWGVVPVALGLVVACGGGSGTGGDTTGTTGTAGHDDLPLSAGRTVPETLRGVTTESVDSLTALRGSLAAHSVAPIVRVVFQPDLSVADYATPIRQLRSTAYLMGQLLDSEEMPDTTAAQVRQRAAEFYEAFGDQVDVWEIGNELNGEWVGSGPDEINAKVQAAFDVLETEKHARTMITLNYWKSADCYAQPWEPTLTYAATIPEEIRNGVDYVSLSIYETACSPRQEPTATEIATALVELGKLFPNSKLAIGEVGAQRASDGVANPSLSEKQQIARKYYGMQAALKSSVGARFVGGYFWWYYYQDAVPQGRSESLWPTLEELLAGL